MRTILKDKEAVFCVDEDMFKKAIKILHEDGYTKWDNGSLLEWVFDRPRYLEYLSGHVYYPIEDGLEKDTVKLSFAEFEDRLNKMENIFPVTRKQMQEIYEIACPTWKPKIEAIVKSYLGVFAEEGVLPASVVQEMRAAATADQKPVLDRIFPQPEDGNPFLEEFEPDFTSQISNKLFGNPALLQIGYYEAPDDLRGRSLYIDKEYEVILHPGTGNTSSTIIEIKKKK